MEFSIIYAVLRLEIDERISVGLVIKDGDEITVRYSNKKLRALHALFPPTVAQFAGKMVRSMQRRGTIKTEQDIHYLSRYSNNLIAFSPLQTIDIAPSPKTKQWLFHHYVN